MVTITPLSSLTEIAKFCVLFVLDSLTGRRFEPSAIDGETGSRREETHNGLHSCDVSLGFDSKAPDFPAGLTAQSDTACAGCSWFSVKPPDCDMRSIRLSFLHAKVHPPC